MAQQFFVKKYSSPRDSFNKIIELYGSLAEILAVLFGCEISLLRKSKNYNQLETAVESFNWRSFDIYPNTKILGNILQNYSAQAGVEILKQCWEMPDCEIMSKFNAHVMPTRRADRCEYEAVLHISPNG